MPNKVSIIFEANESALLRSQKRIADAEKATQAELKKTAQAADDAERKITAAKGRAARAPRSASSGWVAGSHGVSPLVLDPATMRSRSAMLARVERSLRGGGGAGDPMVAAAEANIGRELAARSLRGTREARMMAAARFNGIDVNDHDAVRFARWQRAQQLRGERSESRRSAWHASTSSAHEEMLVEARSNWQKDLASKERIKIKNQQARQQLAQSTLAVGAAVAGVAAYASQELDRYSDAILSAEQSLAGAYGVGGNSRQRSTIRGELIRGSISSGLSLGTMGDLRGRMESAFDDMPLQAKRAAEKAAIQYGKLGVTDVTQTALGLGAAYQFYGKKLGGGENAMKTLANRLAYSADVGAFDPNQVTPYLADVLGTFSALGYSDSEAFGALASASKSGMRAEKFTTALRNIPLTLTDAAGRGKFKFSGSFAGDMAQLGQLSKSELLDIVGRDAFPVVELMRQQGPQYQEYVANLQKLGPGSNVLGGKIGSSLSFDAMGPLANTIASARQVQENAPLLQMADLLMGKAVEEWELRKAGGDRELHPMASWAKYPAVWAETALDWSVLGFKSRNPMLKAGAREVINAKRSSGDNFMADYLELKYNPDEAFSYTTRDGGRVLAGGEEAERLRSFYRAGYTDLSAGELMQYMQIQSAGGNAQEYLDKKGRPKVTAAQATTPVEQFSSAVEKFAATVDRAASGGMFDAQRR